MIPISRSMWYSVLLRVCEGATTILSPVWIPSGSKFSMLHTVMQLSYASRTTSYSTSFQPFKLSSTNTCGEYAKAAFTFSINSSSLCTNPLPFPPSANAARMSSGKPIFRPASSALDRLVHAKLRGTSTEIFCNSLLNISRSSVLIMDATGVPSTRTLCFFKMPSSSSATPQFKAVCPPKASKIPSGFSLAITFSTKYGLIGKK